MTHKWFTWFSRLGGRSKKRALSNNSSSSLPAPHPAEDHASLARNHRNTSQPADLNVSTPSSSSLSHRIDALNRLPRSATPPSSSHQPALNEDVATFGFKTLYEPSLPDNPAVDIIAVHGLNGHRDKTWTEVDRSREQQMWLRDLVPKSIPNARVVTYGYDAEVDGLSRQTLFRHAQDFVVRLTQFRNEQARRPILFVAHGTGGIVLQLALLEAFRANDMHLPDHEAIKFSTYGIIFLGTPHQGLSSTALSQAETDTAHKLNAHLQPNSEYLEDLVAMFTPIRGYFDIKFIYETRPEAGQTDLTVFKASAVLPGAANIETLGLNRDHAALARFASAKDGDYQALVSILINMAKKAPEAVETHWHTKTLGAEANLRAIFLRMEEMLNRHSQVAATPTQPDENVCLFQDGQPPPPHLFLGRVKELEEMRNILLKNSSPRLAILGPGGMGKSTMAQQLLNDKEVLKSFPVPLFIPCENLVTPIAILHAVADILHIPIDQRGSSLQTNVTKQLRSRPGSLLCLDNFEDVWDPPSTRHTIEDLLAVLDAIQSIGIIVTMRGTERPRNLNWTNPQPLPLQPLEDEPALALIQAISNCSHDSLFELLKDVDNIPLAIKLLGRLVEEEGLVYVIREWKRDGLKVVNRGDTADTRTTSVTASIDLSLKSPRISNIPHIYDILGILAILPDGLSESMIDVLKARLPAGVDLRRVLQALKRIALCYLDSTGRYRLLAAIREHVQKALSPSTGFLDSVRSTFLNHIIDRETTGDHDVIIPELANIRSFIAPESTTWDNMCILACLSYLRWEDRIFGIRDIPLALTALSHANTPILQVRYRLLISKLFRFSSRNGKARECLIPALSIATGNPYWEGRVRLGLGEVEKMLQKYDEAETSFCQAVELFRKAREPSWDGIALHRFGSLLRAWGRLSEAEKPLIRSLGLARKAGNTIEEGNALRELGVVFRRTGRMSDAGSALYQAINCYQRSHSIFNEALAFRSLGQVQCETGDLEQAERSFLEARSLSVRVHDPTGEAEVLRYLGLMYTKMGDQVGLAERHFKDALVIEERNDLQDGQAYVLEDLGGLYSQHGQPLKAISCWAIAIAFRLRRLHQSKRRRVIPICARIQEVLESLLVERALPKPIRA